MRIFNLLLHIWLLAVRLGLRLPGKRAVAHLEQRQSADARRSARMEILKCEATRINVS